MSDLIFEIPRDATRIWDLEVPIVVNTKEKSIKMFLSGPIEEPFNYNEACYLLETADEDTTVDLYINCPGGVIDSAFMLINAIKRCKAKVIGHLTGTVASAGTIIALSCDELDVAPHLSFMIHNYSGGIQGKG